MSRVAEALSAFLITLLALLLYYDLTLPLVAGVVAFVMCYLLLPDDIGRIGKIGKILIAELVSIATALTTLYTFYVVSSLPSWILGWLGLFTAAFIITYILSLALSLALLGDFSDFSLVILVRARYGYGAILFSLFTGLFIFIIGILLIINIISEAIWEQIARIGLIVVILLLFRELLMLKFEYLAHVLPLGYISFVYLLIMSSVGICYAFGRVDEFIKIWSWILVIPLVLIRLIKAKDDATYLIRKYLIWKVLYLRPWIKVDLKVSKLRENERGKMTIIVENTKNVIVRDVTLSLTYNSKDISVNPDSIELGNMDEFSKRSIKVSVKPKRAGKIPITATVEYYSPFHEKWYKKSVKLTLNVTKVERRTIEKVSEMTVKERPPTDKYVVLGLIGQGGFGRVFKCKRKKDNEIVAVKVPYLEESAGKSFLEEVKKWSLLRHINIVEIYDYNVFPYPYIEMEFCDKSLKGVKLNVRDALKLACCIADALSYAHSKGVVHGDLKPSNVLIRDGIPKLTDWGIGYTPAYAPPEVVINGEKPDEKSDVWSFGVLLYELVTGINPFQGDDIVEIMKNIESMNKLNLEEAGILKDIIGMCLIKDKDERASIEEVRAKLRDLNISSLSKSLSRSRSKEERASISMLIINEYISTGEIEKALSRAEFLHEKGFISPKAYEIMRTLFDLMKSDKIELEELEMKFDHILSLLPNDWRKQFENDKWIGVRIRRIIELSPPGATIRKGDEFYEDLQNVIIPRVVDMLGRIACK